MNGLIVPLNGVGAEETRDAEYDAKRDKGDEKAKKEQFVD